MTALLLDTNILIWYFEHNPRLGPRVLTAIEQANTVHVSAVSVWEFAIKRALGKIEAPDNLLEMIASKDFLELKPSFVHAMRAGGLPPLHADPFDRMLVAQALCEDLTLVTADRQLAGYGAKLLMAA